MTSLCAAARTTVPSSATISPACSMDGAAISAKPWLVAVMEAPFSIVTPPRFAPGPAGSSWFVRNAATVDEPRICSGSSVLPMPYFRKNALLLVTSFVNRSSELAINECVFTCAPAPKIMPLRLSR